MASDLIRIACIKLVGTRLVMEGSWGEREAGTHDSTMTLNRWDGQEDYACIEWDIPGLGETVHIGLWFDGKTLTDYDGTMSLPAEAIKLLRDNGYIVDAEFED